MNLKGKTIIVTGASSGIGLALTRELLSRGANVAGWSRSRPAVEAQEGFLFCKTDITNREAVAQAFQETMRFGRDNIHGLVNNAGYGLFRNMEDFTHGQWEQMFAVNVHGLFYATKYVLPVMRAQKEGHIINISSIAGTTGIKQGTAYCGTKWAVRGISQALYKEVKGDNIKVSCVFPGSVNTKFFDPVEGTNANETMLHPEDIAEMIIHLLESPDNFNPSELELRPMNVRYE